MQRLRTHSIICLVLLSIISLSLWLPFCSNAFCCLQDTAGALEGSTSMKSLWMEVSTQAKMLRHTETFQPSRAASRGESDDKNERRTAERSRDKKQKAPLSFRLPNSSHFRCSLWSLLPRFRSSQTERSCQTFDVFICLGHDPALCS